MKNIQKEQWKMNLEELKKNNQIVQENQVVPSIVKMDYYLIEPEIIKDLYQMEQVMVEDIAIMKKKLQDTQEKLLKDNISILQLETRIERNGSRTEKQDFQNKMENRINNFLGGVIDISNMVSNSQVNNRPKRRIRRYKTLSKQAMKEYAIKKANSSGFDWFEDEEEL